MNDCISGGLKCVAWSAYGVILSLPAAFFFLVIICVRLTISNRPRDPDAWDDIVYCNEYTTNASRFGGTNYNWEGESHMRHIYSVSFQNHWAPIDPQLQLKLFTFFILFYFLIANKRILTVAELVSILFVHLHFPPYELSALCLTASLVMKILAKSKISQQNEAKPQEIHWSKGWPSFKKFQSSSCCFPLYVCFVAMFLHIYSAWFFMLAWILVSSSLPNEKLPKRSSKWTRHCWW